MDKVDKSIFLAVDKYCYSSGFTKWLLLHGHKICASMRKFDLPGRTVLDLGCGTGHHFSFIEKANIVGLDIMDEALEVAKTRLPGSRGTLIKGDIRDIKLASRSVDSAVAIGVLEHIKEIDTAVSEIRRVLKPGGELIVLQHTDGFAMRLGRKLTTGRYVRGSLGLDYEGYMRDSWFYKDVLRKLGYWFSLDKLVGVPFYVPILSLNAYMVGRFVNGSGS